MANRDAAWLLGEAQVLKAKLDFTAATLAEVVTKHHDEVAKLEAERDRLREALRLIAEGRWASQGGYATGIPGARNCARAALHGKPE